LICEWSLKLVNEGFKVLVVTDERHLAGYVEDSDKNNATLREFLDQNNIKHISSKNVNTDHRVLNKITSLTLGVSVSASWIFKESFIKLFNGKLVNLHGTRLPQDRGGGGFSWRILRNDRLGFSVIHQIDPGIDTGNIIKYNEYFYPLQCRIPIDYLNYSIKQYNALLEEFFSEVRGGKEFRALTQLEYLSTYWPRIHTDAQGYINWSWKLKEIEQFICAFDEPYKGAATYTSNNKVRIKNCVSTVNDGTFHPFQKGIIYKKTANALFVAAEGGSLIFNTVLDQDNKDIKHSLRVGDRFYTPLNFLEHAMQLRAFYTPEGLKK